jgi:sugar lactone lactonase YvrE
MTKYRGWLLIIIILAFVSLSVIAFAQDGEDPPDEIVIEHPNLFPEGIEYDDESGNFMVGSASEGSIYIVAEDGTATLLAENEDLETNAGIVGIEIDRTNNRLLAAVGDVYAFPPNQAKLAAYDLETGERLFLVDLAEEYESEEHLANDVAVDSDGYAYVTDTFSPVIYRVDMDGNVSVFLEDEALMFTNGIVFHPDGYLLLGAAFGQLYKIPLDEPTITTIELDEGIEFDITDGMVLHPDGSLIMLTDPGSMIFRLTSDDDWASATVESTGGSHEEGWGTTIALRGEDAYVIYSHLNVVTEEDVEQDTFEIQRVTFE